MDRQSSGKLGERMAEEHLQKVGLQILARNWRCKLGEIDLVCQDGGCLVFVEVKTKIGSSFGSPEEMVNWRKRQKLEVLAQIYPSKLLERRIDVVAVVLDHSGALVRLNHYQAI